MLNTAAHYHRGPKTGNGWISRFEKNTNFFYEVEGEILQRKLMMECSAKLERMCIF